MAVFNVVSHNPNSTVRLFLTCSPLHVAYPLTSLSNSRRLATPRIYRPGYSPSHRTPMAKFTAGTAEDHDPSQDRTAAGAAEATAGSAEQPETGPGPG